MLAEPWLERRRPARRRPARRALRRALLLGLLHAGCGYSLARKGQQPLRVAAVRNDTAEAEAGGLFAAELRTELHARGRLAEETEAPAGVAVPKVSPASIDAELVALRSTTSSLSGAGAQAFRLEAQVKLRTGDYEDTAVGAEDFLAGVDVLGTEANRRAALRRVLRQLAHELVERLEVAGRLR